MEDLNRIMSNIYGAGATQSFDDISFSGGRRRPTVSFKKPKIKYLDIGYFNTKALKESKYSSHTKRSKPNRKQANNQYRDMTGGVAKNKLDHVYPSALYIPDSSVENFSSTFLLKYLFSHAHKNSIFLIPSTKEFQRLKKDFEDKLKAEKIPECTPEASKYAAKTALLFKAYILDVFGENENDGQPYRIDPAQISANDIKIVQRTNRLNQKMQVEVGKNKMLVSFLDRPNEKAECEILGIAAGDVIVAKCVLPKFELNTAHNNIITANLAGGNTKKVLRNAFLKLVNRYRDIDRASYEFIAAIGDANRQQLSNLANYYSGDYTHTAFSILMDGKNFSINTDPSSYNSHAVHNALINLYKPKQSNINLNKASSVIKNIIDQACKTNSGRSSNVAFVKMLHKMYDTSSAPKYMLKADVATALCEACGEVDPTETVEHAFNIVDEIDGIESNTVADNNFMNAAMMGGNRHHSSTPIINIVGQALLRYPFTGHMAREHVPMLYKSVAKSRICSNAFDDVMNHDQESNSIFQYVTENSENNENGDKTNTDTTGDAGNTDITSKPEDTGENKEEKPNEPQKPSDNPQPPTNTPSENQMSHKTIDITTFF